MTNALQVFILAGEPSGDQIGADLAGRLRLRRAITLSGIGGPALAGQGLVSQFPMSDLAVMGISDVLARLPLLWWRMRQTVRAILRERPDIVVLIDFQVFSASVARRLRRRGYRGPIVLYVAPSVWAWRPERAKTLHGVFDEVLAVLPFEPKVMHELGGPPTSYVGHPALQTIEIRNTVPERGPMLLLPGSRGGELRRHLPLMEQVAAAFSGHRRVSELVLPTPSSRQAEVAAAVSQWKTKVTVVSGAEAKAAAFSTAIAAAAVSGTVTLELALAGVPMAVAYASDRRQYRHWLEAGSPRVALPNILADQPIVSELVGTELQAERIIAELGILLDDPLAASTQLDGFRAIREIMARDAADPADRILAHVI